MSRTLSLLLIALLLPTPLSSVAVDFPTNEQVSKAARESEQVLKRLDPGYKGLDKAASVSGVKTPDILVAPGASQAFSLDALARQYSVSGKAQESKRSTDLLVFVTLAMPAESLRRLAVQAERAGAVLVLRGLKNNSMRETTAAVHAIAGKASWQINPPAFTRFNIQATPSFVMAHSTPQDAGRAPQEGCAPTDSFVLVSGDASLDYALETIEKGSLEWGAEASFFLEKMRGKQ